MHLEHVNLTVADLDRSIGFYQQLLGFEVRWSGTTTDGRRAAHVGSEGQYLALFEASQASRPDVNYARVGFNHFGIVVDDLDAARDRLGVLGVESASEADYEPGRRLYFFDPDGIEVELVEYASVSTA